ncbi:hypothetical protein [Halobacillus sp. B29]|uniref:hypothetical protein n=1 Tax=Halobacillus sp. B29 TaxID=3457432 RepID=UPI003FCE2702
MKKLGWMFALLVLLMGLVACGGDDFAGDSEANGETKSEETATNGDSEEGSSNESSEKAEKEEKAAEPKLELVQQAEGAWEDSIGETWVHSSAVYENTGDTPVSIGETQMTFESESGEVLGTAPMIYAVPEVVQPGETAFISESTILEGVSADQFAGTSFNFGFDQADTESNVLEVSGTKGTKGDEYTPYKVTGKVKNTTDAMQEDIRLAAGLFSSDGELLGVLTGSVDVGVNPGSEAGFELTYPEIPKENVDKIKKVEVKAYAWTW